MTSKTDGSVTASYVEAQIQNRASETLRQALSKSALRSQIGNFQLSEELLPG